MSAEVDCWQRQGFLGPRRVLPTPVAVALAERLVAELDAATAFEAAADFSYYKSHLVFEAVDVIAHSVGVVEAARSVVGDDLLLWDTNVPFKRAGSSSHFTWHQDATYWGLEPPDAAVTVWVALGEVTPASGAIQFIPGSHRDGPQPHVQNPEPDVMLRRGQRLVEVDRDAAVTMELAAGEASLHHPWAVHGSGPNESDLDRVGVVCVYVSASVVPVGRRDSAQQVVGRSDRPVWNRRRTAFAPEPRVESSLSATARAAHATALERMGRRVVKHSGNGPGG